MLPVSRTLLRSATWSSSFAPARTVAGRRFITTEPPHVRSRSWKSSALRWGIAVAGIYYYNTSPVFAERPESNLLNPNVDALETESPTLDALTASSRRKSEKDASVLQSAIEKTSADHASPDPAEQHLSDTPGISDSPADLEEEAASEGAFNPVTGEINWDCSCLGGMAYGPCGPEFREAFSCFVYSTEEPKGMECIDKFQNMQNCFRAHPDVYKGEIEDEEELDAELAQEREELVKKIAERKKAVSEKAQSQDANRLLEEPVNEEKQKKAKPSKKEKDNQSATPTSEGQSQPKTKPAGTSEPRPGVSTEHEGFIEGTNSNIARNPQIKAVETASVVVDELVPKAAHDATSRSTS